MIQGDGQIKLHTGRNISFSYNQSVYDVMKICAEDRQIKSNSFPLFLLVSDNGFLFPFNKEFPRGLEKTTLELVEINSTLDWLFSNDIECFTYYYSQCHKKVLAYCQIYPDAYNEFVTDLMSLEIARFSSSHALKFKNTADLLKKYFMIHKFPNNDEAIKSVLKNKLKVILKLHSTHYMFMKDYLTKFANYAEENAELKAFLQMFRSYKVLYKASRFQSNSVGDLIINEKGIHLKCENNYFVDISHKDVKSVSCNEDSTFTLTTTSDKLHHVQVEPRNFESAIAIIDFYYRLIIDQTHALISCLPGVETDSRALQFNRYADESQTKINDFNIIEESVEIHKQVSWEVAKTAFEHYQLVDGWYMVIEKKADTFFLIFCLDKTVHEKIIIVKGRKFFLHDRPAEQYNSLLALIKSSRFMRKDKTCLTLLFQLTVQMLKNLEEPGKRRSLITDMTNMECVVLDEETLISSVHNGSWSNKNTQRKVKVFVYDKHKMDNPSLQNYLTTVGILACKSHLNVLSVFGACVSDEGLKCITEFIMNYRLSEFFRHQELTQNSLLKIGRQLGSALLFLHSLGIIHGHPAPQHIFIDKATNEIKLADIQILPSLFQSSGSDSLINESADSGSLCLLRWLAPQCFLKESAFQEAIIDRYNFNQLLICQIT